MICNKPMVAVLFCTRKVVRAPVIYPKPVNGQTGRWFFDQNIPGNGLHRLKQSVKAGKDQPEPENTVPKVTG